MNKEEENIDKVFNQEASSSVSNQYDEKYWEEYIQFKKEYDSTKKRKRIIPFFFLLFILIIGGFSVYYFNNKSKKKEVVATNTVSKNYDIDINDKSKNSQNKKAIETSVNYEGKNANPLFENKNGQKHTANQLTTNSLSKIKQNSNTNKTDSKLLTKVSQPQQGSKTSVQNTKNNNLRKNTVASSQINDFTRDTNPSKSNNTHVLGSTQSAPKKDSMSNNQSVSNNKKPLNNKANYELFVVKPNLKDLVNYTFLSISTDTNLFYTKREDSALQKFHIPNSTFSFLGGVFTGKNYNHSKLYVGLTVGGKYYYHFAKKWNTSLGLNAQYKLTSNSKFIQTNYQYDLGYREKKWVNSFTNFVSIEIPLAINYSINNKHSIGIQASYFYLVGFENEKTKTNNLFLGSESSSFSESKKEKGYWDIFNRNDYGIGLNYGYNMNKNLSFNLGYLYGLTDVSNNKYILNFDRNNQLKIWLEYKF